MNFLAHAHVALAESDDPAFVLGAMLPDFATMAGARLASRPQPDPRVQRGVALHLRSDDVFHAHPVFSELAANVTERLSAEGVGRGTARAVGHVGVELLMDGELVGREGLQRAYIGALNATTDLSVVTRRDEDSVRLRALLSRLREHGPPFDYARPEGVTLRLRMALEARPRLRPRASDLAPIETALRAVQPIVRRRLDPLLEAVSDASHER